jgi:hypothetical protein
MVGCNFITEYNYRGIHKAQSLSLIHEATIIVTTSYFTWLCCESLEAFPITFDNQRNMNVDLPLLLKVCSSRVYGIT